MTKKLDAVRIELSRQKNERSNHSSKEKRRIQETIAKNRNGERKGRIILPKKKPYTFQDAPKVRVAAYCRVSTAEEAQAGSFEMQIQHFKALIDSTPNYELVKIYTDEGISGTSLKRRAGFQSMIEAAVAGRIDLILTKSISRFGRNIVDILATLQKLSDLEPPVAVNFESQNILSSDGKNKLVISMLSALAELESQQKSIAVKEGIRYRMQEGLFKFSVKNTLGYYRDYSGLVKIEPAEAEIVKYIFTSFLEGSTAQEIAASLTQQGIRSPKGLSNWRAETIRNILANEKYCGDVLYQKTYSKDYLSHKSRKNQGRLPQWYWENNHPAIIAKETWNQVQELIHSGHRTKRKTPLAAMEKKFVISKVKSGPLRGFFLLDMNWTANERQQFQDFIHHQQNNNKHLTERN